jgi:FMN phosphatase YigB (HAD superfamily)
MKDTILFDLDGTLLPMDFDAFMTYYFHQMGEFFGDLIDGKTLMNYVWEATNQMIQINDGRSNNDIFMDHFKTLIDGDLEVYQDRFDAFYDTVFTHVKASTWTSLHMIESVRLLQEKGYKLVIATNPLFPLVANLHRIRWAGFEPSIFTHITSLEENTACKPNPLFFKEVLQTIGKEPHQCLMVGNDVSDDLGARVLGIETFIVTDCLLNPNNQTYETEYEGNYEAFYTFVQELPDLNKG